MLNLRRGALRSAVRAVAVLSCLLALTPRGLAQPRVLDGFDDVSGWRVIAAEGVRGAIARDPGGIDGTPCLRLDFEFVTGGGYCIVQRDLPMDLPENYEFTFHCRAAPGTPDNNLEFKLLDESGENVWWVNRRAIAFPTAWQRFVNKKRHIEFAWGPAGAGAPLKRLGKVELVIASSSGGKGSVFFDNLAFRALPPSRPYEGVPELSASSAAPGHPPTLATDGNVQTAWRSTDANAAGAHTLTIDFGIVREFGGLTLEWEPGHAAGAFDVRTSDDGQHWALAYAATRASPARNHVPLPDAECRFLQLSMTAGRPGVPVGLAEVAVQPPEFGEPNGMFAIIAKASPRGRLPRYFLGEQRFWTVVGDPDGGPLEALLSEDGALELGPKGPTVEPMVLLNDRLHTWADSRITQGLERGYLPLPWVEWAAAGLSLRVCASDDAGGWRTAYVLTNTGAERAVGALVLAVRPFQVNPPSQWLNTTGGVARLTGVEHDAASRTLTLAPSGTRLAFDAPLSAFIVRSFDQGDPVAALAAGGKAALAVGPGPEDSSGRSSALAIFDFDLGPGQSREIALAAKPRGVEMAPPAPGARAAAVERWSSRVDRVAFDLPPSAQPLWDTARTVLGHVLINRDGPAIQPGSRSYERSWARDGSMTSAALLEFGFTDEVRQWIEWFASHQFESGKVPCVVDTRGPDPVSEHDSHGQLIFAIAEYHRFTGDSAFLRRVWPSVQKAVAYIESIRAERMTPEFAPGSAATRREPGKPPVPATAFFGLVPESISHEGYSAKPMHSYWDDFFVLKGLKDAAYIAGALGEPDAATRYAELAADFRRTLLASIAAARSAHGIDYLPGCVELGDFDATSTTVALWPCGEQAHLPADALRATFDCYWNFFQQRRDDPSFAWVDYTPYENRVIGSFVRLGQRERALALTDFLMRGRRPVQSHAGSGWNQWPEVVYRDERAPRFLGDLPHTWCGSDFLNAFRAMFAHERESPDGEALVLLAGVPERWLRDAGNRGLGFTGLRTHFGPLTCRAMLDADRAVVTIEGLTREPPGGVWVANPFDESAPPARLAGGRAVITRP